MIQASDQDVLQGNAEVRNFSIELNSTMFDMIVSKVYTDKVLAVVREWSTNAIDACIDAKKPIKFETHLPTLLEPYFSVRDYGTGLSDDDVLGLYSTLGASTKRESNDFNGTFGIGRGAGLAYSTRFQVDSYYNGQKISYVVSTDGGIPAMISLGSVATKEPNGLCVQVNVAPKDISAFAQKATDVYQFFEHKPDTNFTLTYPEVDKVIDGEDWYLERTQYGSRYHCTPLVIMGNVAYQIDKAQFDTRDLYEILSSSIRFDVPLGAVAITPGRESLSMDETTVAYLTKRFKTAQADATASLIKTLGNYKTDWEKMVAYNKATNAMPHGLRGSGAAWTPKNVKYVQHTLRGSGTIQLDTEDLPAEVTWSYYERYRKSGRDMRTDYTQLPVSENVCFMISDVGTGFADAAKSYQTTSGTNARVILVKMTKYKKADVATFVTKAKQVIKDLGGPTYVMASDYLSTPTTRISTSGQKVITVKDFAPLLPRYERYRGAVKFVKGDMLSSMKKSKYYYVEMSGHVLQNLGEDEIAAYYNFFNLYAEQTKDKDFAVVGVPKGALKNIVKDLRFIPLKTVALSLQSKVKIVDHSEVDELKSLFSYFHSSELDELLTKLQNKEVISTITTLRTFGKAHPNTQQDTRGITKFLPKVAAVSPKTKLQIADLRLRYPMLEDIQRSWSNRMSNVTRYMMLEDCYNQHGTT